MTDVLYQQARNYEAAGHIGAAVETYERWLRTQQAAYEKPPKPMSDKAISDMKRWNETGNAHIARNAFNEALAAYKEILKINPEAPVGLCNVAVALFHLRRLDEAEALLFKALKIKPNYANAFNMLGGCFNDTGRHALALAAFRLTAAAAPNLAIAWINLAKSYYAFKNYGLAIDAYQRALALDPNHVETLGGILNILRLVCQWQHCEHFQQRLSAVLQAGATTDPFTVATYLPELQKANATRWSGLHYPYASPYQVTQPLPADRRNDGKLRIGYVSSDLQRHATASLMMPLLEQHDRSRFSIYVYSYGKEDGSPERARIRQAADIFHDISTASAQAIDALIRQDEIDILVDLKGYTRDARLDILAMRPAPIAMHYLGYPGTLGASFIDYFLADEVTVPAGQENTFTEAVIRLPHSYQMNDRQRPLPEAKPRSEYGLPEGAFVFCAFNNAYKIRPDIFSVWMRVLAHMPGSVLWFHESHAEATGNLIREAAAQGIDASRLIPATTLPPAEHLARYAHADLCLDTFPVCGHTTTSDALWCGVPVVTLAGEHFISRVSASLLTAVSLPELMTHSMDAYEAKILELAKNPAKLNALRQHLQEGRMTFPLFDSAATTRAIEAAYLHAATLHRHHSMPQAFSITNPLEVAA